MQFLRNETAAYVLPLHLECKTMLDLGSQDVLTTVTIGDIRPGPHAGLALRHAIIPDPEIATLVIASFINKIST
ncbi:hypothetical protein [Phaffia rhodozyma]|uniref:Uncharacterized protein n=1 Tax=Phaffia rhodozyma TaxID=264483 RepID=A0A0F7SST3_PHARH|nr:hypothetical protein [Phaffia rhodozyma]